MVSFDGGFVRQVDDVTASDSRLTVTSARATPQAIFLVFLYTIDGQHSNVLCCHNDTVACSTSGFVNFSHVPGNVNVISFVITAAPSFLILRSVEAILIALWAQ